MKFEMSRCKGCGTDFSWKLFCPNCGRALPIVGAAVIMIVLIIVSVVAKLLGLA